MTLLTTAPARRAAYHLDGTQASCFGSFPTIIATQAQLNNMNDEEFSSDYGFNTTSAATSATIGMVFPQKCNIYKYFLYAATSTAGTYTLSSISVSYDTTDGINGTWSALTIPTPNGFMFTNSTNGGLTYQLSKSEWFDDTKISGTLSGATAIKGIQFYITFSGSILFYLKSLNLYGEINDSSATQRVEWTDNAGVALTTDKCFSTVVNNANIIGGQYLKNLHTNATSQIVFSIDGEVATVNNNVTISVDGGTTYNVLPYTWTTSLASGAVSSEIKVKYLPTTEVLGLKYYGIIATPTFA